MYFYVRSFWKAIILQRRIQNFRVLEGALSTYYFARISPKKLQYNGRKLDVDYGREVQILVCRSATEISLLPLPYTHTE